MRHSRPEFKAYQQNAVINARARERTQKQGFDLVGGGTDNHLMLIDLRKTGVTARAAAPSDEVYITANKNAKHPETNRKVRSSPRACASARPLVTTRGFGAPEMLRIAEFIWQAAN